MSNRLAFQTQLASIMEVLANAAVAEICKLVDDDYAVVSLQMSQCQRENKALKRKLHLLELKMARGHAERRLRESALSGGRARVQLNDRLRLSSPSAEGGEFEQHVDVTLWHDRCALEDSTNNKPVHPDSPQSKSPDVELVQPDVMLVKEENVEDNMPQLEGMDGDPPLIRSDGALDRVPRAAAGHQATLKELNNQCHFSSRSSRVEVSDDSSQLKFEPDASVEERDSPPQSLNPLFADDHCNTAHVAAPCEDKAHDLAIGDVFDKSSLPELPGTESCSYSMAAIDFPSTSRSINGWAHYKPGFTQPATLRGRGRPFQQGGRMDRHYACTYCGKAFNRPKKLEIHQRVHTGERPFSCSTCGKMFAEAGNLKKHQRVHTGEQPYTCVLCGKGFAWIRNLKTHQFKSHPEVYPDMEP